MRRASTDGVRRQHLITLDLSAIKARTCFNQPIAVAGAASLGADGLVSTLPLTNYASRNCRGLAAAPNAFNNVKYWRNGLTFAPRYRQYGVLECAKRCQAGSQLETTCGRRYFAVVMAVRAGELITEARRSTLCLAYQFQIRARFGLQERSTEL